MDQIVALDNALMKGLELPVSRKINTPGVKLPQGTTVISADSHWEIHTDLFFERLPTNLKPKALRVRLQDDVMKYGFAGPDGKIVDLLTPEVLEIGEANSRVAGAYDLAVRQKHMDVEGVQQEIVFPGFMNVMMHHPGHDLREAHFRIYNEYIAERDRESGGRSHGVGILSNWWDEDKYEGAVRQIVDLGLKTFMIPYDAGKNREGKPNVYSEPTHDRMWKAIEESGLPLCFHVGEGSKISGRGGWGIRVMVSLQPFLTPLANLIFGGILDRCPKLQVVFAEGGISWVPVTLQDAEMIYDSYPGLHNLVPKLRPTEYWARNCYATFMNDKLGLENLEHLGADRIMWGSDYPHAEGTWGYSQGSMQTVVDMTSDADAKKILGGNAMRVFKL